jgi:hypothetical protein
MDTEGVLAGTAKAVIAVFLLAVVGIFAAYWWANTPPNRPRGLAAGAVWLWAPAVGLPAPKRGMWVSCMINPDDRRPYCQMNDKKGQLLYRGPFAPQTAKAMKTVGPMEIDVQKMDFELSVFIESALVPLVVIKDCEVLIPAAAFERGLKVLNAHQRP